MPGLESYLVSDAKTEKQRRASEKVDQWVQEVMDYAHGVGELHRQHGKMEGE